MQPLNSGTAQALAGTEGATNPFWSADSQYLGYFANGKLNKIDANGGPPQALCDAPNGRGGTWNRDGMIVFASDQSGWLMRVDATGGTPVKVTELAAGMTLQLLPRFLPDGKHFLYYSLSVSGVDRGAVYAGALGSKEQVLVLHNDSRAIYSPPGYLLFVRNGTLMAQRFNTRKLAVEGDAVPVAGHVDSGNLTVSSNGVLLFQEGGIVTASQLIWFDRAGKQIELAFPETARYFDPMLSPDGSKLAVAIADSPATSDIWVIDLARKTKTRITFGPGRNTRPVWWPDGKSIVFARIERAGTPCTAGRPTAPVLMKSYWKHLALDLCRILFRPMDATSHTNFPDRIPAGQVTSGQSPLLAIRSLSQWPTPHSMKWVQPFHPMVSGSLI